MALAIADARPVPTQAISPPAELADCVAAGVYRPPAELPIETWITHGQALARRWAGLLWLEADWARVGLDYYGPIARSYLCAVSGRDRDSLRQMVATSRRFPPERRRLRVPFSLYRVVASLPDEAADQLLLRAEREGWTRQDLSRHVRAYRGQPTRPKQARQTRPAASATTTTAIVTPAVTESRDTAPIRCSCLLVVAYAVGRLAVTSTGPAAVQRVGTGQLAMNVECMSCGSTTLISLSALEIPTSSCLAAGAG